MWGTRAPRAHRKLQSVGPTLRADAQSAQLKALTNGPAAGAKLTKSQKKQIAAQKKVLALTNGGVGDGSAQRAPGGKANGKGKPKLNSKLPENMGGLSICYDFGKGKCTRANCTMAHKCQICFGDHAYTECPKYKNA